MPDLLQLTDMQIARLKSFSRSPRQTARDDRQIQHAAPQTPQTDRDYVRKTQR